LACARRIVKLGQRSEEENHRMTAAPALQAYLDAFAAKNVEAVAALFAEGAIYELPLLGQRLVGRREITAGLARAFALTERCAFEIGAAQSSGTATIAEGCLKAKLHRDRDPVEMPAAIVLQTRDGAIARLSTYLDARPYRLWSDGPIFAVTR
jgi:ketosteroid isomerase-like protein